jgi:4-alpha-glucanotransferase
MNTPGTSDDNWGWRVTTDVLEQKDAWDALKELTEKHGR